MNYFLPLEEGGYYHIYNRGNNGDNIFYSEENYRYFLIKFDEYLSGYLEVYAYCLLPNHFHFLVRVKEIEELAGGRSSTSLRSGTSKRGLIKGSKTLTNTHEIISELFRRFFTAYAKAINKQQSRTGSLFQKNFKRKQITNDVYFSQLVYYIHANPQQHGISNNFKEYPFSSYGSILKDASTKLNKRQVIKWFGDKRAYINFHEAQQQYKSMNDWAIEE